MNLDEYWQAVHAYCERTLGSCDSWGRTPERSVAVGGYETDPHTWWMGADIIYTGGMRTGWPRPLNIPTQQAEAYADSLGLEIIHEKDHDHLQPKGWETLTQAQKEEATHGSGA